MTPTFWANQRVVITGGCGLVGARLTQFLLDAGARVYVLDNLSRGKQKIDGAEYWDSDVGSVQECEWYFKQVKPDAIFNLAAHVAGVTYNARHQIEMFERNLPLQSAPVYAAAKTGVARFLQVSSVCVYAENKQNPCHEEDTGGEPNAANSGYAWAKQMGERITLWSTLPHCVIVRPANIYGINDYFDERAHVIPALIRKCVEDDAIRVNGTGKAVREFLYSDDAARDRKSVV
jgi:nucleoside-diphosphate-sugar epimerase